MTEPKTKKCSRCGKRLKIEQFSIMRAAKDGHQAWDRKCVRDHRRELRARYAAIREEAAAGTDRLHA